MKVVDALTLLGAQRVVWVDDHFNRDALGLAKLLIDGLEVTRECGIPEIAQLLESYSASDPSATRDAIAEVLADTEDARRDQIRQIWFEKERELQKRSGFELHFNSVGKICEILNIKPADQLTFESAESSFVQLCKDGDADTLYIIDLNDAHGHENEAGLDLVHLLIKNETKGNIFILTNSTEQNTEHEREDHLSQKLKEKVGSDAIPIPLCVLSKNRLNQQGEEDLEQGLAVALKRVGLRRNIYTVINGADAHLKSAFEEARKQFLNIPPAHLDAYVITRGLQEGVSELHVIERALTSTASAKVRNWLATDDAVQQCAISLRKWSAIETDAIEPPHDNLIAMFQNEFWDAGDIINRSLAPIGCGDVFVVNEGQPGARYFVLIGSPCDMQLRNDGKRSEPFAVLAQIKTFQNDKAKNENVERQKVLSLRYPLLGKQWNCDFRHTSVARLSILDLASFRADGAVMYEENQEKMPALLLGQSIIFDDRIKAPKAELSKFLSGTQVKERLSRIDLQLTFSGEKPFNAINVPCATRAANKNSELPANLFWNLRRAGRIRMPYAVELLDKYTSIMNRMAFDVDYTQLGNRQKKAPISIPIAGVNLEASAE
jgi:hypothetical protein